MVITSDVAETIVSFRVMNSRYGGEKVATFDNAPVTAELSKATADAQEEIGMSDVIRDELEIKMLNDRYSDALNRMDMPGVRACYTDDATWEAGAPLNVRFEGLDAIMGFNEMMVGTLSMIVQTTGSHVISIDGDSATLRSTAHEVAVAKEGGGMQQYGLYHSRLARTAQGWRFAERRFEMIIQSTDAPAGTVYVDRQASTATG